MQSAQFDSCVLCMDCISAEKCLRLFIIMKFSLMRSCMESWLPPKCLLFATDWVKSNNLLCSLPSQKLLLISHVYFPHHIGFQSDWSTCYYFLVHRNPFCLSCPSTFYKALTFIQILYKNRPLFSHLFATIPTDN